MLRNNQIALSACLVVWFLCASPADAQKVGQVSALLQGAHRNTKLLNLKDSIEQNDLIATDSFGRVRAELLDGSILSVGSGSQLKVAQHDATSQQTVIELNAGKLRNQVIKLTAPGSKFQIHTPNAVIGVIGTDFFVQYEHNRTTVICYVGQVTATPIGKAKVETMPDNAVLLAEGAIRIGPNQMTVITSEIRGLAAKPASPPQGVLETNIDTSIRETQIPDGYTKRPGPRWLHKGWEGPTIVAAAAGGTIAGFILANSGSSGKSLSPTLP